MIKNVTMKDVAEKLNISTVTVSKALTGKDGVSEELRGQIKKTSEEMGYRYNASAKALKEGRSYNVGVIMESHYVYDELDTFYLRMYQGITKCLTKLDYACILELITFEMEDELVLPNLISSNKVDGIIILGQLKTDYLVKIQETALKTVYLDFYDKQMEVDSVITDSVYGAYLLTNYIASMGHKKIAYVGNIHSTASILDRYLGYYRSLLVNGLEVRPEYLISDRGKDGLFIDIEFPEDMPTAFVCNCDELAYILMEKLKTLGYRIPEDISVVGFDNYTFAGYSTPRLTTVEVNIDLMTEMAVDTLIKHFNGEKDIHGRKVIGGKLIIRDSVAKINNN